MRGKKNHTDESCSAGICPERTTRSTCDRLLAIRERASPTVPGASSDARAGGLQQAVRLAERDAGTIGRRSGFEQIDRRIANIAGLVEFPQEFNHLHRPLARPHANLDDLARLLPANLAVNQTIGGRLGKMEKIKQR